MQYWHFFMTTIRIAGNGPKGAKIHMECGGLPPLSRAEKRRRAAALQGVEMKTDELFDAIRRNDADAVAALLDDPARAVDMARRARQAIAVYTWPQVRDRWAAAYGAEV